MKKYFISVCVLLLTISSFAQERVEKEKKGFQKDNLFLGGNFGLTFGDYTLINISPQLGYHFTQHLAAGVGINAQYVSYKERDYYTNDPVYKTAQGVAGLNIFGRVYPIQYLMLQVQPELNYVFGKQIFYQPPPRQEYNLDAVIVPSLLVGGGAVIPAGRGSFIAALFYDALQKENNPYGKRAILSFGYNVGL